MILLLLIRLDSGMGRMADIIFHGTLGSLADVTYDVETQIYK